MSKFLDSDGLSHFWGAVKEYVDTRPGGGGAVEWEDINGRPDLSDVSSMTVIQTSLLHDLWDENNQQTVTIPGVLEDENQQLIIPVPKKNSEDIYRESGISCVEQGENELAFYAKNIPESDLFVNVFIFGAAEIKESFIGDFVWWSPEMTSDTTPTPYVAKASTTLNDTTARAFAAFDSDDNNYWHTTSNDEGPWVSFDFGSRTVIKGLSIRARVNPGSPQIMPSYGDIEGSDDGSTWSRIASFSNWTRRDDGRVEEIIFDNPVLYRHYRIVNMDPGYTGFAEVRFFKREGT